MAERRATHTRQNTSLSGSQIISQECSGQLSPKPLSPTELDSVNHQDLETGEPLRPRFKTTCDRFLRRGKKPVGVIQSIKKIYGCSCASPPPVRCGQVLIVFTGLNLLLLLTPVAWWAHFDENMVDYHTAVFSRMSSAD